MFLVIMNNCGKIHGDETVIKFHHFVTKFGTCTKISLSAANTSHNYDVLMGRLGKGVGEGKV